MTSWDWRRELKIWRVGAWPGLIAIALVMLARATGQLQLFEKMALDALLRLRPAESVDERILIIGIDEADIRQVGAYPIPDRTLTQLLQTLQRHQPAVIGLDLFRDLPVEPGHADWVKTLQQTPNLIGIAKVLPDQSGLTVNPPPLPPGQVGFVDTVLDADGDLRRSLLSTPTPGGYQFSLTFRLTERYLTQQDITAENGRYDPEAIRFGNTELPRFQPNTGGYIQADAGGSQTLINFRSGPQPFRVVSLRQIMAGAVADDWIRGRIVLIGATALSVGDVVNTGAIQPRSGRTGLSAGLNFGVEVQAHAVSQIVSAVLDHRPLLKVWDEGWEYLWIFGWGFLGISLGRLIISPLKLLLGLSITSLLLGGVCYSALTLGWWIPLVPALLVLVLNGAGLTASLFYQHQQNLQARLQERQLVIEQTFDTIHNGPLQTLARTLRHLQEQNRYADPLYRDLEGLNHELRAVYDIVRREATQGNSFHFSSDLSLDLQTQLHEVLYAVYSHTLTREFPHFKTLKIQLTTFEEIDSRFLSIEQKRGICRFLEEALCNAGKHAVGMTQLTVICKQEQGKNLIRVADNGIDNRTSKGTYNSTVSPPILGVAIDKATDRKNILDSAFPQALQGRGSQQALALARQLGGKFHRFPNPTGKGWVCELIWSANRPWFWRFR